MESYHSEFEKKEEIYRLESSKKARNGVEIPIDLCLYTPKQVLNAINQNTRIKNWLHFISESYLPPKEKSFVLFYPCSTVKPYSESRSYVALNKTISSLPRKKREKIQIISISEPFGLIPEEFYNQLQIWYDCPGLFEWWVKKHKLPYSDECLENCLEILANCVAKFLIRTKDEYRKRFALIRTYSSSLNRKKDHTHIRILDRAQEISGIKIEVMPSRCVISDIVKERGRFAWDMYGVAHPLTQKYLRNFLNNGGLQV